MQFSTRSPYLVEIVTERHRMAQEQYVMQERSTEPAKAESAIAGVIHTP